jgi:hypothetical protein
MEGLDMRQHDQNGKVCIAVPPWFLAVCVLQAANRSNAHVSVHRKFLKVYQYLAAGIA